MTASYLIVSYRTVSCHTVSYRIVSYHNKIKTEYSFHFVILYGQIFGNFPMSQRSLTLDYYTNCLYLLSCWTLYLKYLCLIFLC